MMYPQPYMEYLAHYHGTRDYFECHEIMEEYWKQEGASPFTKAWLGLIQLAVGQYHERRGNWAGAVKMMGQGIRHLSLSDLSQLGLDGELLLNRMRERLHMIEQVKQADEEGMPRPEDYVYRDLNIPISDPSLLREAESLCGTLGGVWQIPSSEVRREIIDRHLTRDRSGVVAERRRQLEERLRRRDPGRPSDGEG